MREEPLSTEQLANMRPAEPAQPQAPAARPRGRGHGRTAARSCSNPVTGESMTTKWREIQADFVDHPRQAMKDADALVAGLMQQLAKTFADERAQLEAQWSRGDDVSTEDLRVSLQRYRAFFERLLAV